MDTSTTRALTGLGVLIILWPSLAAAQDAPAEDPPAEVDEAGGELSEEELAELEELDELDELDEDEEEEPSMGRLKPIIVEYEPEDIAKEHGSAKKFDKERLDELKTDDINAFLPTTTGVYVRQEDGFGLRPNIGIRGANSERSKKITLMEDGILFGPAPYSAPAAYYFPIMSRMTGLEVYKGPGSISYGPNTIGGSLNLITREPPVGSSGGMEVAVGSLPSAKLHAWHGASTTRAGILAEGIHLQSAGFKELDGGGPTGFRRSEAMLKGHVNSDPSEFVFHKVSVKGTYSTERSYETYLGLSDEDFEENPYRRYVASSLDEMNWWRMSIVASHKVEVGDDFDLTSTIYRHDFDRAWKKFNAFGDGTSATDVLEDPDVGRRRIFYDVLTGEQDSSSSEEELIIGTNARQFTSQGAQMLLRHRHEAKTWSNKVEAGMRLHADQIERRHTEEYYGVEEMELVRTEEDERLATHNLDNSTALAVHVLDQLSVSRFTLTPGMRFELIKNSRDDKLANTQTENYQQVLIPGFGMAVALGESLDAIAGIHRGFSPVAPGQPEEVTPELSTAYEGGVRWADERGSFAELIGFYNDYRNLVGECTFAAGCEEEDLDDQFNAGRARIYGAEAAFEHRFPLAKQRALPLRFAYTYTNATFLSPFESKNPQYGSVEAGDQLPYVPPHQLSAGIGLLDEAFDLYLGSTYVSAMREEASQGDDGRLTDPQVLIDVLAAYRMGERRRLYFKVDNVLGATPVASRRPYGARTIKPRFFQLGFEYGWGD